MASHDESNREHRMVSVLSVLPLDPVDVSTALTEQLRPHQRPCSCGQPSAWCFLGQEEQWMDEDRWRCHTCVPRGCACHPTEAYQDACDLADEDGRAHPRFDAQRHGRRNGQGEVLPCVEWWAMTEAPAQEAGLGWTGAAA